jgi:hypothetical protein
LFINPVANSKGKKQLQKALKESGQWTQLLAALKPPVPSPVPFWKTCARWLGSFVAFLAALAGLYAAYPWLSVEKDEMLDPNNPYSEMFLVGNGGYVPTTEMQVQCSPDFVTDKDNYVLRSSLDIANFQIDYLGHGGTATLPCFELVRTFSFSRLKRAKLTIKITYAFIHLNISWLRKSQSFQFVATLGSDGHLHWMTAPSSN